MYEEIKQCADFIAQRTRAFDPEVGIILGTGLGDFADHIDVKYAIDYKDDSANRHSTVFHAVPLTSKIHKKTYLPTHIFISSFKAVGLRTNSIAQCEQLCDVKDTDLIEKIGKVSKNQLRQITKGMQIQLGMSTKHNNPIA